MPTQIFLDALQSAPEGEWFCDLCIPIIENMKQSSPIARTPTLSTATTPSPTTPPFGVDYNSRVPKAKRRAESSHSSPAVAPVVAPKVPKLQSRCRA